MNAFRMMMVTLAMALAGSLMAAAEPGPEQQPDKDIIIRTDGKPQPPTFVKQDNYLQIIGDKGEKVAGYLVKDILYANRDSNYDQAIAKRDEGRFTLAALYFSRALEAMPQVKWAEEYCNYGMGAALFDVGYYRGYTGKTGTVYSPPSVYFQKAIKANPKSRFMLDVTMKMPQCLAEEAFDNDGKLVNPAKLDEADAAMKEAEKTLKSYRDETVRIADGFKVVSDRASAQLLITDAHLSEKRVLANKDNLNTVKDKWMLASGVRTDAFPELKGEAVDGLLQTLVQMKEYTQAQGEAKRLIDKFNKDGDQKMYPLLPGAYTVMGKASFAQAVDYEGKNQPVQANAAYADARWAFLHVIAQFFDNDEYVASAHYFAGLCYDKLRTIESDAGEKAVRHWKLIEKNFPKSNYKAKASEELARVGGGGGDAPAPKKEEKKDDKKDAPAPAK
jgi:tetratricopeptide (TPR) repeat protein